MDGWDGGYMEVVVVVVFVVGAGGVAVSTRRWILVVVTVRVHGDGGGSDGRLELALWASWYETMIVYFSRPAGISFGFVWV